MKTTILKLSVLAISLCLGACGKTLVGTKVQKGGVGPKSDVEASENKLISLNDVKDSGSLSLQNIMKSFKQHPDDIAVVTTWNLEIGNKLLKDFKPISSGDAGLTKLRTTLFLNSNMGLNPVYINTTLGAIANGDSEVRGITNLLKSKASSSGETILFDNGVKATIQGKPNATTLSLIVDTGARTYEYRSGGILITTYTPLSAFDKQLPSSCGDVDDLVVKQSLYIQFGKELTDIPVALPLWDLIVSQVSKPKISATSGNSSPAKLLATPVANLNSPNKPPGKSTASGPPPRKSAPPITVAPKPDAPAPDTSDVQRLAFKRISPVVWESIVNAIKNNAVGLNQAVCE